VIPGSCRHSSLARGFILLAILFFGATMAKPQTLSVTDPSLPFAAVALKSKLEQYLAIASDDSVSLRDRVNDMIRLGTRSARLKYSRSAAVSDFSRREDGDSLLNSYRNLGFNTVALNDQLGFSGGQWEYMTDAQIEAAILQARRYKMNIILGIIANDSPENGIVEMTPETLKDRFARWIKHDRGDIIGVYLLSDDPYLTRVPVQTQNNWRNALREVSTSVPVLGMIGELSLLLTEEEREQFFSPYTFDHLLVMTYPFNLTNNPTYGTAVLNQVRIVNPSIIELNHNSYDLEIELPQYIDACYTLFNERFFTKMHKGQGIIPVIESFEYTGAPAGTYVTSTALRMLAEATTRAVSDVTSTTEWSAVNFFLWGDGTDTPTGITSHSEWWDEIAIANDRLRRTGKVSTEGQVLSRFVLGVH
jgi:hypothetical protein